MTVEIGERAPPFRLPDRPGHVIELTERIGRRPVVLFFFPLAFSSVCTTEMCAVRDEWHDWSGLNADILAISVDSPFVTARFRETHDLPFPVLSDFNRKAAAEYGVLYEDFYGLKGVAKRAVFVIDRHGMIAYRWVSDDADVEPDYVAIRAVVERAGKSGP